MMGIGLLLFLCCLLCGQRCNQQCRSAAMKEYAAAAGEETYSQLQALEADFHQEMASWVCSPGKLQQIRHRSWKTVNCAFCMILVTLVGATIIGATMVATFKYTCDACY